MRLRPDHLAVALAAALMACAAPVIAGPGDVVIPAHRTRDGTLVPASVPTTSGGTYLPVARRGKVSAKALRPASRGGGAARPVPIFMAAEPILK